MNKIMHRHHKIPTHAGGINAPSNIEMLSVEEHAEAHRLLFEQHGRLEDKLAWLGLAGIIGKEEIVKEAQRLGGKKSLANGNPWQGKKTSANWALDKSNQEKASIAAHSETAAMKRKITFQERKHQQGENNSNFGKSVYVNQDGDRKRFSAGQQPDGWVTPTEFLDKQKNKKHNCYGKNWWNDGMNNFLLNKEDAESRGLKRGRINCSFSKTA